MFGILQAANASADATRDEDTEDIPAVDFGVVVSGKPQFEVCRLFLASLQLVSIYLGAYSKVYSTPPSISVLS